MTRRILTAAPMQTDLDVQRATTSPGIPGDEQFQCWVEAALAGDISAHTLVIRIVDEQEARRFNRDYRNKDQATNILSFPAELPEGLPSEIRQSQLGDLLICAPLVATEATERCRPATDHWAHLTIHGVLHLLGFDHGEVEEAGIMETMETEILAKLDIPDPYKDLG
jgi:probable rRNA maturation factor